MLEHCPDERANSLQRSKLNRKYKTRVFRFQIVLPN